MKIERLSERDYVWKISLSTEKEKDVSRLWLFEHQVRFGSAQLRTGGIGGVGTKEAHRYKGYARQVMEDSTAFMAEEGFDIGMLFGIANFYPKFGYATVLPETWVEFNTEDALSATRLYRVREFQKANVPSLIAIYNANNAERTGTLVRFAGRWNGFSKGTAFGQDAAPFVLEDESGEVSGYFVCDETEKHCKLADIGFKDQDIFSTVVRFLADRASGIEADQVSCSLPADHPFAVFLRRYGARTVLRHPKNSGCMMRLINQSRLFQKITGELERRLKRSVAHSQWSGTLQFTTELGTDSLAIDRGRISHTVGPTNSYRLEIPQDKFIQLMMGRRNIEDLTFDADVTVNAELIPLLETLFPVSAAHVWWPDRF